MANIPSYGTNSVTPKLRSKSEEDGDEPLHSVVHDGSDKNSLNAGNLLAQKTLSATNKTKLNVVTKYYTEDNNGSNELTDGSVHYTTNFETMIHLLKANIGPGILAMPDAFKNMGLIAGLFLMMSLGFLCVHCQHILLGCSKELTLRLNERTLTYYEVAEYAFKRGPEKVQKYSVVARRIIKLFLIVTQLGFCTVYFVFIATNITQVINTYTSGNYEVAAIMAITLPFMILFNFIKSLKTLAPLSMFANIITCAGLIIVFYYICKSFPPMSSRAYIADYSKWPLFYGTAIYTFEGIGMVLPIENKMKNPADFRGMTGVLNTGMVIVASLFCAMGFYGYLQFGDVVYGSITLNLPPEILYDSVKILFAIAVFITFSLMLYVPVDTLWPEISRFIPNPRLRNIAEYGFRAFLVTFSFAMAELIPRLDTVIALVGAVGSSGLALIFPPLIEIIMRYPNKYGKFHWILIKDIFLCTFGLFGFFIGSYAAIYSAVYSTGTSLQH